MSSESKLFALVGNPNSGKTTLFNRLTGLRQKVGNYPGVTVEKKEGIAYTQHGKKVTILDLPGSYSLNATSPDEVILVDALMGRIPDLKLPDAVICCLDGSNLERNLYLATQVIETGLPVILVVNMMDVAKSRGIEIDLNKLSKDLGVKVIGTEASKGKGILDLKLALSQPVSVGEFSLEESELLSEAIDDVSQIARGKGKLPVSVSRAESSLVLHADLAAEDGRPESTKIRLWQQRFDREVPGWRSNAIQQRYQKIGEIVQDCSRRFDPSRKSPTQIIDSFLLHPVFGFIVLAGILTLLFYSVFSLATPFMDAIDGAVGWLGELSANQLPEGAFRDLIVDGIIGGVGGVIIFLPQILLLFFFISLLESSGYMARGAFLLDRMMSKVGLHGRSFIPLLSSYACAVPGIMATRTIESPKDRLVTILVAPFMTCAARLPVYLVMIAAILPSDAGHAWKKAALLLFLYFLGTITALFCALIFHKTLMKGAKQPMVLELPGYKLPRIGYILQEMFDRSFIFLKRAGTVIFALSIILWFLLTYPKGDISENSLSVPVSSEIETPSEVEILEATEDNHLKSSYAGRVGRFLEPAFEPVGYDWQITIGIIASFAAREVFVSTMAIIYGVDEEEEDGLLATLRAAKRDNGEPLFSMLTCLSILIFFVFALQCISTVAVVKRETQSWSWAAFQFVYMFAFAWGAAFIVYQGGQMLGFQ